METWLNNAIDYVCLLFTPQTMLYYDFNVRAMLALILIGLICGAVGSLVVGNRMAFFSDALAHSAFAGVAIGILLAIYFRLPHDQFFEMIPVVMIVFGIITGLGIAVVRERTGQASDTVIGVFFAGAIGLGAIGLKVGSTITRFPTDDFLFGNLAGVTAGHLLALAALLALTLGLLAWMYNDLVFASFNTSLAQSRRVRLRLQNYLFIALLAIIVNQCLSAVGALLINALLVVPAATAVNISRNMRQLFRWSVILCLTTALLGQWISWNVGFNVRLGADHVREATLGEGGTIVLLNVFLFFASMVIGPLLKARGSVVVAAKPTSL